MRNPDRCIGAYIGAAIGDAMGGPVEASHYKRIRKYAGEVRGLLPYERPYLIEERWQDPRGTFRPGYALHPDAGSVTDDTFCRKDVTNFYLDTKPPRTPEMLVDWLLENAELDRQWPQIMVGALRRVKNGEVAARECGLTYKQGGGIGWWFPVGIVHGGNPEAAANEVRSLSSIWKAPLEQDLLAGVVAAIAEGVQDNASIESMLDAMFAQCGPLATRILERAVSIAVQASDIWDLAERLYKSVLMPETAHIWEVTESDPPTAIDAPLPPVYQTVDYTEDRCSTYFFAEQIPLALAAFVYSKGAPSAIPACINLGRDCDTTGTVVGAWVGALNGELGLPKVWVDTVCRVNMNELDLRSLAQRLYLVES